MSKTQKKKDETKGKKAGEKIKQEKGDERNFEDTNRWKKCFCLNK